MFGKRNRPIQPEQPRQGSGHGPGGGAPSGPPPGEGEFPWAGDPSLVACNLASGNLAYNLPSWVEHEGRVHAETYVATSAPSPAMPPSDRCGSATPRRSCRCSRLRQARNTCSAMPSTAGTPGGRNARAMC